MKEVIKNKLLYLFIIPITLFAIGFGYSLWYTLSLDAHYTVMPVVQKEDSVISSPRNELTDKDIIRGEFRAADNNLGSVALKLRMEHEEPGADRFKVFFRIKEKGAKDWFSINSYNGGQFREHELFPFGFNLIPDAKNKLYYFEIYTQGVNEKNALSILDNQRIVGLYQLNKSDLKKPAYAINYLKGKYLYLFQNVSSLLASLFYFIPIVSYLYLITENGREKTLSTFVFVKKIERNVKNLINMLLYFCFNINILEEYDDIKNISILQILLVFAMIIDVFFIHARENLLMYMVMLIWIVTIYIYHSRLVSSFLFAILFLSLSFFLVLLDMGIQAEKASIWAYLFLLTGTTHALISIRKRDYIK